VGARAFHLVGRGGNILVAGGKDGVKRGFSILDFGFLIVPRVQIIEVLRAKKQRYRGCFGCDK
jgi:hypothetical protein